ncbi:hypothetical protein ACU70A_06670 [Syntrophomonas erecta subsp. sporosyntropha]
MKSFQARLMLIMGYLGAVVGAGFASGQEIVQFFVTYGALGWRGYHSGTSYVYGVWGVAA